MTTPLVLRYSSRNLAEACLKLASEYMNGLFNDLVDPDLARSGPSYAAGTRSRHAAHRAAGMRPSLKLAAASALLSLPRRAVDRQAIMAYILRTLEEPIYPMSKQGHGPAGGGGGGGGTGGAGQHGASSGHHHHHHHGSGGAGSNSSAGDDGRKRKKLSDYQTQRAAQSAGGGARDARDGAGGGSSEESPAKVARTGDAAAFPAPPSRSAPGPPRPDDRAKATSEPTPGAPPAEPAPSAAPAAAAPAPPPEAPPEAPAGAA